MDNYWILEYVKVLGSYLFLMFLWPTVVFWKHLRGKSKIYHFNFCILVQPVLVNTVVLMLGLFHVLSMALTVGLFYSAFLISVWRMAKMEKGRKLFAELRMSRNVFSSKIRECLLLVAVLGFAVIYFSYGAFQAYCYGSSDLVVHHSWVNRLVEGEIFPNGVYPEAMHCFIYCLHALFGIRIYSIIKFLQCIHLIAFFFSAYSLLREVFGWRYSPIFVLTFYLTLNITNWGCLYSIYRLQFTLPMEFGLHTQFLCALYLIRYLKRTSHIRRKEGVSKYCWDENLFLFMMSLAASIAIHYYTTIMAFILCASFAIFCIRKLFCPKYLIPLVTSVMCGFAIAGVPMAAALVSGIPFESSINWGLKEISSNSNSNSSSDNEERQAYGNVEHVRKPLEPTYEDWETIGKLPDAGQRIIRSMIKAEYFVKETYKAGYLGMYGEERGKKVFGVTVVMIGVCLLAKRLRYRRIGELCNGFFPVILASFLSMIIYMAYEAPELGLPVLISGNRFDSSAHMFVLAVMMMPVDLLFSALALKKEFTLDILSVFFTFGIYVFVNLNGVYHEYLYYSLTRYNSAVMVTNSIIDEFERESYTIVSPYEEACQVNLYGEYEEIRDFIEKSESGFYSIPTEYVFLYVEKRPIVYRQYFFFSGPSWLGESGNSVIESTSISEEFVQKDITGLDGKTLYREGRVILESKAYDWSRWFSRQHPSVLKVYYEDDDFVCYYFRQDKNETYNLARDGI